MAFLGTKPKVVGKSLLSKVNLPWTPFPQRGSPALELFLNKTEQRLFPVLPGKAEEFNLTREQYLTMRNPQSNRNVIIKPADKWSAVVVWTGPKWLFERDRKTVER